MKALYSVQPYKEVEVTGTPAEWQAFGAALARNGTTVLCESVASVAPYSGCAKQICIRHEPRRKVTFAISDDGQVIVSGDPDLLGKLSESTWNFANDFPKESHIHVDYQGDDYWVDIESASTVFVLEP